MKKLSIITPTLNCGTTLGATIASISALMQQGGEHILVDSGSTDGTVSLARAAGARVEFFPRGNMYAAINAGMACGSGEWLTYINGDDILYADAVAEALDMAPAGVDVIYGNIDYIDDAGRFLFSWRSPPVTQLLRFMSVYSAIPQQGTFFRRQVFERLGGFNTDFRYSADYDFWVRALEAGFQFGKYSQRTLAAFRLMPTQLSQARKAEMAPEGVAIRKRLASRRTRWGQVFNKGAATVFRVSANLDNYWLRATRGRGLDRR